jgi:hypothetical protein
MGKQDMTVKKAKTVKTDKPGVSPKIKNLKPPKRIPEEGGIYYASFSYGSRYYVFLGGLYWGLISPGSKSSLEDCGYFSISYKGNLKDFRPEAKRAGYYNVDDYIEISTEVSGLKYKDWYRMNSASREKKSQEAFRKYLTGVLLEFDPGPLAEDYESGWGPNLGIPKPWWKVWY